MLLANGFCKSSEQGDFPYINIYVFKFPTPEYTIYKDTNLTFDNFIVENMLFAYAIVRTCYLHMLQLEHAILYAIVRDSCDIGFRGFQVQVNAEFPRQVMNFPIEYDSADVV